MNRCTINPTRFSFLLLFTTLALGSILTGCADAVISADEHNQAQRQRTEEPKFRHAHLLDKAMHFEGTGKSASAGTLGLIVAAEDEVAKQRIAERYKVTGRYKVAGRYKVTERYEYDHVFEGFAWTIEDSLASNEYEEFLDSLAQDPDVLWFEPDFDLESPVPSTSTGSTGQQIPWSVAAVGGQTSWTVSGDGQGFVNVDVYILDTGVANAWSNDPNDDLALTESRDFRSGYNDAVDYDGHGTHIAGIVGAIDDYDNLVGIAPGAWIHNFKVLGDEGTGAVSQTIAAIEEITARRLANPYWPIVVNLSLGDDVYTTDYTALDEAVEASIEAGVVYVIAAGNHGINAASVSPAKVPGAITVGSYDMSGHFSGFSNWGPKIDLLAPGENIISLSRASGPVSMSGTSMAAAHVTGAAALYLAQNPSATPAEVEEALVDDAPEFVTGTNGSTTNKSVWVGQGPAPGSGPGGSTIIELRVDGGTDDAEESTNMGWVYTHSPDLELSNDYDPSHPTYLAGIRFSDSDIPQGATITNAYIQFTAAATSSGTTHLTIHGEDHDNADEFEENAYNISNRTLTSASVAWSPQAWTSVGASGTAQRTPNLAPILQELVNRPGWDADNLVFVLSGSGVRTAYSWNGHANKAPLLHVEWTP